MEQHGLAELHQQRRSNPISTSTPSRYQVYLWEIANRGTTIGGKTILGNRQRSVVSPATPIAYKSAGLFAAASPAMAGIVPGGTNVDRRRISAAVINCHAYDVHGGGGTVYPVLKWIEFFLVEPSLQRDRTDRERRLCRDYRRNVIGRWIERGPGGSARHAVSHQMIRLVRLARCTSGAAAAEMALALPILLVLLFGSAEIGNYFMNEHILVKAVRDGARYAARQDFSNFSSCSGAPGGTVDADTKNVVMTGLVSGGTNRLRNWNATTITVTVELHAPRREARRSAASTPATRIEWHADRRADRHGQRDGSL